MKHIYAYTVFVMSVFFCYQAQAQLIPGVKDTKLPIEISADSLDVLQRDQKAVFTGNVLAEQGDIDLNSEKMTVFYRKNEGEEKELGQGVSKIIVEGDVFLSTPRETARSTEGVYDVDKALVTLEGSVVLTKNNNVLKGNRLVYDMNSGKSQLFGSKGDNAAGGQNKGRVKGLFVPKE